MQETMKSDYQFKTEPYVHQRERFFTDRDKEFFAYLWEMGAGKTKIILDTAAHLYNYGKIDLLLVVAPNGVHRNWIYEECPTHLPEHVNYRGYFWVPKSKQTKKDGIEMQRVFNHPDGLRVFAVNVDTLSNKAGKEMIKNLLCGFRTLMVIDESTTIKSHKAGRTDNLLKIAKHAKYRRILTGTPVNNNPLDIFTQFQFLDEYILKDQSYYSFRSRYADLQEISLPNRKPFKKVLGYRDLDKLQALIAPHSHRITKAECLDLPEKIYIKRLVELTDQQRSLYTQMKKDLFVQLGLQTVTAPLALTKFLRLQQIVGGFIGGANDIVSELDDEEQAMILPGARNGLSGDVIALDSNRISVMMEALEEIDGKVIIWSRFVPEIEAIITALREAYGFGSTVAYYGAVSNDDRAEAINRFQGRRPIVENGVRKEWGKIPVDQQARFFVGNAQSAGMGLTLTAATTVIYYSNSFSYANRLQSEDRAHRIGQHFPVTYIDMVAEGTMDEYIIKALRQKQDFARTITGDEWKEWI